MVEDGQASSPWRFEGAEIGDLAAEARLLVLVVIGKFLCGLDQMERVLREEVRVYQVGEGEKGEKFNCVSWVRDALGVLRRDGLVSGREMAWAEMTKNAEEFVERKKNEGRWYGGWSGGDGVPCWDLLDGEERSVS